MQPKPVPIHKVVEFYGRVNVTQNDRDLFSYPDLSAEIVPFEQESGDAGDVLFFFTESECQKYYDSECYEHSMPYF